MKSTFLQKFLLCAAGALGFSSCGLIAADTSWLVNRPYGLFVHYFPGSSRLMPTANVGSVGNIDAAIPSYLSATESSWSKTVEDFDVDTLAQQVVATGANYLVFTLGQTNGYYCCPNSVYETTMGMPPGRFTSKRDLISDLSTALYNADPTHNTKLIVYLAVEGPNNSQSIDGFDPKVGAYANLGLSNGDYRRNVWLPMIREWSDRWASQGGKVAGWWVDGCNNPAFSDSSQIVDQDIINACKANYPQAFVCLNPQVDALGQQFKYVSQYQDWIAGEDYMFRRYPEGGDNIDGHRWQSTCYLGYDKDGSPNAFGELASGVGNPYRVGTGWGNPTASRFDNPEIRAYIKQVTERNGCVTVDVAVNQDGTMWGPHFQQMLWVNQNMNIPSNELDLAKYKPVQFKTNTGDGTRELDTNDVKNFAIYAVDGKDDGRFALAGGELNYNLRVDLLEPRTVRSCKVKFPLDRYPDLYAVDYSNDAVNWLNWTERSDSATGAAGHTFYDRAVTARYWRLRSSAVSGNRQMAVSVFSLFEGSPEVIPGHIYRVTARHSGKALDVGGAASADGANVIQWTSNGGLNQQWMVEDAGDGTFRLTPQHSLGSCLEVTTGSLANGANIHQWTYGGLSHQKWTIDSLGGGFSKIVARHSGKVVAVDGASTAEGANVLQWAFGHWVVRMRHSARLAWRAPLVIRLQVSTHSRGLGSELAARLTMGTFSMISSRATVPLPRR
jgi:hypothetical protein